MVKDKWNAVCLPFAITVADFAPVSMTIQTFNGVKGNTFVFSDVSSVKPGQPFIVKPTADIKVLNFTKDIVEDSTSSAADNYDG